MTPTRESSITRRRLVGGTAAAGAAVGLSAAVPGVAAAATVERSIADFVAPDPLLHLLRRATFGPTTASVAEIRQLGAVEWLNRQLSPAAIADPVCDGLVARFPLAQLSIDAVRAKVRAGEFKLYSWEPSLQLSYAAVGRAIWSKRQLFEVMVDFWSNHLNVAVLAGDVWASRPDYDRTVIRQHTLGRFADMLKASAKHPAMLSYLDNRFSTKAAPNENYGRELLELHTVGMIYSEADVKNAARLLTGMTVNWETDLYRYDATSHATGPVTVLGFTHTNVLPASGEAASAALLDYLAMHPATAQRIATKLCTRFVSDEPPAALVARLAQVYLDNRTAIAPVLRALFTSAEFAASIGAKVRTPFEDVVASVRALEFGPDASGTKGVEALYWIVDSAGQAPMNWGPPNGYPDVANAWASPSGQLVRWNAHLNLAAGWWPSQLVRPANLFTALVGTSLPLTYGALVDVLAQRLFGRTLLPEYRTALCAYWAKTPTTALKSYDGVVSWSFPYLVAMMLNSPYFAVR